MAATALRRAVLLTFLVKVAADAVEDSAWMEMEYSAPEPTPSPTDTAAGTGAPGQDKLVKQLQKLSEQINEMSNKKQTRGKHHYRPSSVPESVGRPLKPPPSEKSEAEVPYTKNAKPTVPGWYYLGSGYDMIKNKLKHRLFKWDVGSKAPTSSENPAYIVPKDVNFYIADKGASETALHVYHNGYDYAKSLCNKAHYEGIAPCILDTKVLNIDTVAARGSIYVEDKKTFTSHRLTSNMQMGSYGKARSPALAAMECRPFEGKDGWKVGDPIADRKFTCDEPGPESRQPDGTDSWSNWGPPTAVPAISFKECCGAKGATFLNMDPALEQEMRSKFGNVSNPCGRQESKGLYEVCQYIHKLKNGDINMGFEGAKTGIMLSMVYDVLRLPDCVIKYSQVANDADFASIGPGVFNDMAADISPGEDETPLPQCNAADMKVFHRFITFHGTHVITSATFGGEIVRGYEIDRKNAVLQGKGPLSSKLSKIILDDSAMNEIVDTPTSVIMQRRAGDNHNVQRASTSHTHGVPHPMPPLGGNATGAHDNGDTGEDGKVHESTDAGGNTGAAHQSPLLRITNSVEGGSDMPTSQAGGGAFTREELQRWIESLRTHGKMIDFHSVEIQFVLMHPLMIRAMVLHCGPGGKSIIAQKATTEEKIEFQAFLFWDLMESNIYKQIPKWAELKQSTCGQILHRHFYTLKNAMEYYRVKAEALYFSKKGEIDKIAETDKVENLLERAYVDWTDALEDVRESNPLSQGSTTNQLWQDLGGYVANTGNSHRLVAPLVEYMSAASSYDESCTDMCGIQRDLYLRQAAFECAAMPSFPIVHPSEKTEKSAKKVTGLLDFFNEKTPAVLAPASGSAPAPGPAPASGSAPAPGPAPASGSAPAPGPAPASGSAPAPGPAPASGSAPAPGPATGSRRRLLSSAPAPAPAPAPAAGAEGAALTGAEEVLLKPKKDSISPLQITDSASDMISQDRVAKCDAKCSKNRNKILDTTYMTDETSDVVGRDLFNAAMALSQTYCEGMFVAEFSSGQTLTETDGVVVYPAEKYCLEMATKFRRDLCLAYKDLLIQLMATRAGVNFDDVIGGHRFLYMAQNVMYNNADYIFMRFPQMDVDRPLSIPNDMIPSDVADNSIKGTLTPAVVTTEETKKKEMRHLGKLLPPEISKVQMTGHTRTDWEPTSRSIQFCKMLLPLRSPKGQTRTGLTLSHMDSDPAKRIEQHRNDWLKTRTKIVERNSEREGTADLTIKAKLSGEIDALGQELWCDKYMYNSAMTAMENEVTEKNIGISRCFMCIRTSENWPVAETCKFFPEKTEKVDEVAAAAKLRFRGQSPKDPHSLSDEELLFGSGGGGGGDAALRTLEELLFGKGDGSGGTLTSNRAVLNRTESVAAEEARADLLLGSPITRAWAHGDEELLLGAHPKTELQSMLGEILGAGDFDGDGRGAPSTGRTLLASSRLRAPDSVTLNVMKNEFGFMDQEKVDCNGNLVMPSKADAEQLLKMKEALLGPQITQEDCKTYLGRLYELLDSKRDILSRIQGTLHRDWKACGVVNDETKQDIVEDPECGRKMFEEFLSLRASVFNAKGNVKHAYQSAVALLRSYGSRGETACQDLGYCESISQEEYVRDWSRNYRRDRALAQQNGIAAPGDGELRGPSYIDARRQGEILKSFNFPMVSNPLFTLNKKQKAAGATAAKR